MFYLRLNKLRILNNHQLLGEANVQLMSFVTLGKADFPMLDEFFQINDPQKKMDLVSQAITKVVCSRVTPAIEHIRDNQKIYFGDTGYNVFVSDSIPDDLNWMLLAVKSNQKVRDNAELLTTILSQSNISSIVKVIGTLAGATNPVIGAITVLSGFVADSLLTLYKNDKDKQLGLLLTSFIRQEHYPHGKRDKEDVPDTTGNMKIDYTIFAY